MEVCVGLKYIMNIDFKTYAKEDKEDILDMMASFNALDSYPFDPVAAKANLRDFTENQSLGRLYLMKDGITNIGYVVLTFGFSFEYNGRDAFIDELYIKEAYRNKGIGKATMDFVESEAKELNVNAIHLEVESHNEQAKKLYVGKGYKSSTRSLLTKRITM